MLPYWLLFLVPAIAVLQERPRQLRTRRRKPTLTGATLLLTVMIGFRYQVGGDWGSYLRYLDRSSYLSFTEVFGQSDPGYILLNWLAAQLVGEIWAVNLLCGLIFSIGLATFARAQPRPWLALLVAIPYQNSRHLPRSASARAANRMLGKDNGSFSAACQSFPSEVEPIAAGTPLTSPMGRGRPEGRLRG